MEITKSIEAYALSTMIVQARNILKDNPDAEALINIPINMVRAVCIQHNSDIYQDVLLSDEQKAKSIEFMTEVITEKENLLKEGLNIIGAVINPIGKEIRERIAKEFDDSPQLRQVIILFRSFGLDIVLGIFDELLNRGVTPRSLLRSIILYQRQAAPTPKFAKIVKANIDLGIISGERDSKEARQGELVGQIGGGAAGMKIGAVIGTFVAPGVGTIVGGAVGSSVGRIVGKEFGNKGGRRFIKKG